MLVTLTEGASIMEIEVTGINVGYFNGMWHPLWKLRLQELGLVTLTEGASIMEIEVTGIYVGYFNGRGIHYGNWGYRD